MPKRTDLPTPARHLIFSFYDEPDADKFFRELADWLGMATEGDRPVSYEQVRRELAAEGRDAGTHGLLLVLDGLEKAQDTGARGPFGQILDGRLRDMVLRAADGYLHGVALIITSRFRLYDPETSGSDYYWPIEVDELEPAAAVALLRARGVRGADVELEPLAREHGCHALTVDLLGGYIARFCDGDPAELPPEPHVPEEEPTGDPETDRIREQERKFARVAERYREAMETTDPTALALLQRICLFRLGVASDTLASIFTGEGKEAFSGEDLARLDRRALEQKLHLLTDMRLLEATGSRSQIANGKSQMYSVHPAVRDGFLRSLDADTARRGHEAAAEGLTTSLGGLPGHGSNPSDPVTLDLLEEIVYHTFAAGHAQDAWDIYRYRIGRYVSLGWRLGAYERGERICRALAGGQAPESAPLPDGLSEQDQALFINEWALYLMDLGRLEGTARCFEHANERHYTSENWKDASVGNQNLAFACVLAGRLVAGLRAAQEALRLAERAHDVEQLFNSRASRAHARALRGETEAAVADFRHALRLQHEGEGEPDRPLWALRGVQQTRHLARVGRGDEAEDLTEQNKSLLIGLRSERQKDVPRCNLVLADLAREGGDLAAARDLLAQAHDWAVARNAKEVLCWAALVRARIALDANRQVPEGYLEEARASIDEGLRIARDCGFGIYYIDLLLVRARLHLLIGDARAAEADAHTALFGLAKADPGQSAYETQPLDKSSLPEARGIFPRAVSGYPDLLATTHSECGYAWGEADARHLLAESLLLQAAQTLGRPHFVPALIDDLPGDARKLIEVAREQLGKCREVRRRIRDPKGSETDAVLRQLEGGVLTEHAARSPTLATVEKAGTDSMLPQASLGGTHDAQASSAPDGFEYGLAVEWGSKAIEQLRSALIESNRLKPAIVFDLLKVESDGAKPGLEAFKLAQEAFHRVWMMADPQGYFAAPRLSEDGSWRQLPANPLHVSETKWLAIADSLKDLPSWRESKDRADAISLLKSKAVLKREDLADAIRMVCNESADLANLTGKLLFAAEKTRAHRARSQLAQGKVSMSEARKDVSQGAQSVAPQPRRFRVALSFPGEHRGFVSQVAERLSDEIGQPRVLYDEYHTAEFARINLDVHLQRLYHDQSDLIAAFVCADYEAKEWCGLEWRAIRDLIKRGVGEAIIVIRLDDAAIDGLFSIDGYINASDRTPEEVARLILQRLELNDQRRQFALSQKPESKPAAREPATPAPAPGGEILLDEVSAAILTELLNARIRYGKGLTVGKVPKWVSSFAYTDVRPALERLVAERRLVLREGEGSAPLSDGDVLLLPNPEEVRRALCEAAGRHDHDLWVNDRVVEIGQQGRSESIEKIDPRLSHEQLVGSTSFQYFTLDLRIAQPRPHVRRMIKTADESATYHEAMLGPRDRVFEKHSDQRGWAISGPYIRLPRNGRYLAVYRVRCQSQDTEERQALRFDVSWDKKTQCQRTVEVSAGSYQTVVRKFAYHGQPDVEIRVHPVFPGTANVLVDTIAVLWLCEL